MGSGTKIKDEFSDLPISNQRRYQLRRQRDKQCTICGAPAAQGDRCLKHLIQTRERQRKARGLKRRNQNSMSYKLEQGTWQAQPRPKPENNPQTASQGKIREEFSDLPISPQRRYQLRRQRDKQCTICGAPAVQGSYCLKHMVELRERQRKSRGLKRRYKNSMSYKLQNGTGEAHRHSRG